MGYMYMYTQGPRAPLQSNYTGYRDVSIIYYDFTSLQLGPISSGMENTKVTIHLPPADYGCILRIMYLIGATRSYIIVMVMS